MHIDAQRKDLLDKLHQAADDAQPPNSKLGWRGVVAIVAFAAILLALPSVSIISETVLAGKFSEVGRPSR